MRQEEENNKCIYILIFISFGSCKIKEDQNGRIAERTKEPFPESEECI